MPWPQISALFFKSSGFRPAVCGSSSRDCKLMLVPGTSEIGVDVTRSAVASKIAADVANARGLTITVTFLLEDRYVFEDLGQ